MASVHTLLLLPRLGKRHTPLDSTERYKNIGILRSGPGRHIPGSQIGMARGGRVPWRRGEACSSKILEDTGWTLAMGSRRR